MSIVKERALNFVEHKRNRELDLNTT